MVTKKSDSFTTTTVGELVEGSRFRVPGTTLWQQIISIEKDADDLYDQSLDIHKQIVRCKTKVDGSIEEFPFTAFSNVNVEVQD